MQCLYISFTFLQGQTNKKVDKHRFIHQRSDLYFGVHGSKYGVFLHHFLRTRIVFLIFSQSKLREDKYIVSWGNFGHGATSVKNSLRNHFGRINNV